MFRRVWNYVAGNIDNVLITVHPENLLDVLQTHQGIEHIGEKLKESYPHIEDALAKEFGEVRTTQTETGLGCVFKAENVVVAYKASDLLVHGQALDIPRVGRFLSAIQGPWLVEHDGSNFRVYAQDWDPDALLKRLDLKPQACRKYWADGTIGFHIERYDP